MKGEGRRDAATRLRTTYGSLMAVTVLLGVVGSCRAAPKLAEAAKGAPAQGPALGPAAAVPMDQGALYAGILADVNFLLNNSASFWMEHGPDDEYGGFKGTVSRNGTSVKPFEKGLIGQSRYLWSFATLRETGEVGPEADPLMEELYTFLVENFLNDTDYLFWMRVDRNGSRLTLDLGPGFKENTVDEEANIRDAGSKQWLYGQAFAIHALAAYARVANDSEAADIAMNAFRYLDDNFHDKQYGGFDQRKDDGLFIDFYGNTKPSGELGKVEKVVNAHLQYLPAYTELYRTTKDPDVAARLYELMDIFATKLPAPGYVAQFYTLNWTALTNKTDNATIIPRVIVGHELETAQYLFEAAEALKGTEWADPAYKLAVKGALNNTRTALAYGYDTKHGGWYNVVNINGTIIDDDHIWWVQNESLPALYRMYGLTGDPKYLTMIQGTLDWIRNFQTDHEFGEQFWGVYPNGTVDTRGTNKGEFWKANYHVTHGLTNLKKLLPAVA